MTIQNTLFGLMYLRYMTRCGCIKYDCNMCKNSKKSFNSRQKYNEIFYLDNDYFGKFDYKYLSNVEINSRILIFDKNMTTMYKEIFSTIKPHGYTLKKNNTPILFHDIPKELINILTKKDIILPKL